eukprot:6861682-Pyramimonas_sp.AAC.1
MEGRGRGGRKGKAEERNEGGGEGGGTLTRSHRVGLREGDAKMKLRRGGHAQGCSVADIADQLHRARWPGRNSEGDFGRKDADMNGGRMGLTLLARSRDGQSIREIARYGKRGLAVAEKLEDDDMRPFFHKASPISHPSGFENRAAAG